MKHTLHLREVFVTQAEQIPRVVMPDDLFPVRRRRQRWTLSILLWIDEANSPRAAMMKPALNWLDQLNDLGKMWQACAVLGLPNLMAVFRLLARCASPGARHAPDQTGFGQSSHRFRRDALLPPPASILKACLSAVRLGGKGKVRSVLIPLGGVWSGLFSGTMPSLPEQGRALFGPSAVLPGNPCTRA